MSSDLQTAIDIASRGSRAARAEATMLMVWHLRTEHGWGIRRLAKQFDLSERQVKAWCKEWGADR